MIIATNLKDYHRIVSSASFRRLQDKTQVFPLDQSDFVRTRWTHSIEVFLGPSLGTDLQPRKFISVASILPLTKDLSTR